MRHRTHPPGALNVLLLAVLVTAVLVTAVLITAVPVGAVPALRVLVNGKALVLGPDDPGPFIQDGRTLVPMRAIFETLGATVGWDPATRSVTGERAGRQVVLRIGDRTATVSGGPVSLDVAPLIHANRTFVPLRFVAEALGAVVGWDGEIRTVSIADLAYVTAADDAAATLLRQALAAGRPAVADLRTRLELVVGQANPPRIALRFDVVGQLRGADQAFVMDQMVRYGGLEVPSRSETVVRAGQVYMKGPAESAFQRQEGPPDWKAMGIPADVDPTRPFHSALLSDIRAIRMGTTGVATQAVILDLGRDWLAPVVGAVAAAGQVEPEQVVFSESQARVEVDAVGQPLQVVIRVAGTVQLPENDGTFVTLPWHLEEAVNWLPAAGAIAWPPLP